MREWELIVERIQANMRAAEAAADAEKKSVATDEAALEPFKAKMEELGSHLEWLKEVLAHVDQYAIEEMVDAFIVSSGSSSRYHRFVHDELHKDA